MDELFGLGVAIYQGVSFIHAYIYTFMQVLFYSFLHSFDRLFVCPFFLPFFLSVTLSVLLSPSFAHYLYHTLLQVASELAESDVGETLPDDVETIQTERTFTSFRPTTFKSLASTNTYKTLQVYTWEFKQLSILK